MNVFAVKPSSVINNTILIHQKTGCPSLISQDEFDAAGSNQKGLENHADTVSRTLRLALNILKFLFVRVDSKLLQKNSRTTMSAYLVNFRIYRVPQSSTLPLLYPAPFCLEVAWPFVDRSIPRRRQACSAASSLAPLTYCPSYQYKAGAVCPVIHAGQQVASVCMHEATKPEDQPEHSIRPCPTVQYSVLIGRKTPGSGHHV